MVLRPHVDADLDAIFERCLDAETIRWTTVPSPYTQAMVKDYLAGLAPSSEQISWAIEVEGNYGGTIDIRSYGCDAEHAAGSLGFVTHPWARGRGVMSEAVRLAANHAFDGLGWRHLTWQSNVGNYASYKSVWRSGFPVPQLVPALLPHRGRMVDAWRSVLESNDPRAPQTPWDEALAALRAEARTAKRSG